MKRSNHISIPGLLTKFTLYPVNVSFFSTAEIEDVLTSSLVQVERSLSEQLNVVAQLRDQSSRFELPDTSQRIDEIMVSVLKGFKLYECIEDSFELFGRRNIKSRVNSM